HDASDVAVVSEGFWRVKLGADPNALGGQIVLGGRSFTVVAVLPKRFTFGLSRSDIWVPLSRFAGNSRDGRPPVRVLARLAPGTTADRVSLTLDEVSSRSNPPARTVVLPVAG